MNIFSFYLLCSYLKYSYSYYSYTFSSIATLHNSPSTAGHIYHNNESVTVAQLDKEITELTLSTGGLRRGDDLLVHQLSHECLGKKN